MKLLAARAAVAYFEALTATISNNTLPEYSGCHVYMDGHAAILAEFL